MSSTNETNGGDAASPAAPAAGTVVSGYNFTPSDIKLAATLFKHMKSVPDVSQSFSQEISCRSLTSHPYHSRNLSIQPDGLHNKVSFDSDHKVISAHMLTLSHYVLLRTYSRIDLPSL